MSEIQVYFKGGKGIEKPVDANGNQIKEGDILTHCWFEDDYNDFYKKHRPDMTKEQIETEVMLPNVVVRWNEKGYFWGEGLEAKGLTPTSRHKSRMYMHDFRFRFAKIVGNIQDSPKMFVSDDSI